MKSLTLVLPNVIYDHAVKQANQHGLEVPAFCVNILVESLIKPVAQCPPQGPAAPRVVHVDSTTPNGGLAPSKPGSQAFDVREAFKGFPMESIRLAERFVEEALKLPGVRAFRKGRGIGFEPNTVFIEYLMSRGGVGGIGASFYGEPQRHRDAPGILKQGRGSYSRAKIRSEAELNAILPVIRQSYELKFGKLD